MHTYVITISGAISEEDAIGILVDILITGYGLQTGEEAEWKGFRRVFTTIGKDEVFSNHNLATDGYIQMRISGMHEYSPVEYMWSGLDKQGMSKYTFWGVSSYRLTRLN